MASAVLAVISILGAGYLILNFAGGDSVSGKLSAIDIAGFAQNAGFTGVDLVTAVAIAIAESGGDPNAYNPETKAKAPVNKGSYGLWQIYLNKHPEYANSNLYDPQTNANAAFAVYSAAGNSFSPWSTFGGGQYQAYLDQANSAVEA
jgi:hypothetical protein